MKKILVLTAIAITIVLFYQFGGREFLLPATYRDLYAAHPWATGAIYFTIYVAVTALSIPGAAAMTLIGGAIFGAWTGLAIVSFASTIGATCAFLVSRTLLRDWVQKRFGSYLSGINRGMEKDGVFYLFAMRLMPGIPFFVINLVMGLTPIRTLTYYLVSQIAMLPGTFVYVYAGDRIGAIDELSPAGILKPGLIAAFVALSLFPFLVRWIMGLVRSARVYRTWKDRKPTRFDNNLIVIGAGSAGLVSAFIGAAVKAKVTLIEKDEMGGDCLNTGCVPSKALIRSAKIRHYVENASHFGINAGGSTVNFADVMNRVEKVIADIEPHDSVERYQSLGVTCVAGEAEVLSPWEVRVNGDVLTAKNIIIATGAEPFVPPIPGLDQVEYLTSESLWSVKELPRRLLIVGGGPIGCELAQAFSRLGSAVTLTDMAPRLLPREDEDVSRHMQAAFRGEGIDVLTDHKTVGFEAKVGDNGKRQLAILEAAGGRHEVEFDKVLIAVGRKARTRGYGFDALELDLRRNATIDVDDYMRTKFPNVFACGDVTGPFQFTHVAAHQAWYAAVNALFGTFRKFKVDYRVTPWATFTDPEVAQVGLNELTAKEHGVEYEVTRYGIDDLDRAIADSEAKGFVKVLTVPGKDKILGVTIAGYQASNMIAEYVLAMKQNIGLNKILGTIHIYPTMAEANKYVAGEWKRANAPTGLLRRLGRFHRWRLG